MSLADNKCVPCRGGVPPLPQDRAQALLKELGRGWTLNKDGHLERLYTFKDFAQALAFVNKVGAVAEAEGHHPDISFGWDYATVGLQTKKIKGLHENDFIMATKIDQIFDRSTKSPSR